MKKLTRVLAVFLLWAMISGLWAVSAYADVPHLINYQGKLTDKDNKPLEGAYQITFRIYDALNGGQLLWHETQNVVIQKGIFSILLGSTVGLDLPFDKPYFLEIKVGDEVMSPRQRIASAGYAFRAEDVDILHSGSIILWHGPIYSIPEGWALCDGTNGTPDLRDKFVVGAGGSYGVGSTGGSATHSHRHLHRQLRWSQDRAFKSGSGSGSVNWNPHEWTDWDDTPASSLPPYYALCYIMKL